MGMAGNKTLVRYGIDTDKSDFRIHVCPRTGCIYIYPTHRGLEAVRSGKYERTPVEREKEGFQRGDSYAIPWDEIEECWEIEMPSDLVPNVNSEENPCMWRNTPTQKGKWAEVLAMKMLGRGLVSFPGVPQPYSITKVEKVTDHKSQIAGIDAIVTIGRGPLAEAREITVQIKMDCPGGSKERGGITGKLYVQTHECNPRGEH
jgi:hypothetical protein